MKSDRNEFHKINNNIVVIIRTFHTVWYGRDGNEQQKQEEWRKKIVAVNRTQNSKWYNQNTVNQIKSKTIYA